MFCWITARVIYCIPFAPVIMHGATDWKNTISGLSVPLRCPKEATYVAFSFLRISEKIMIFFEDLLNGEGYSKALD
jgi:hypothetical protein